MKLTALKVYAGLAGHRVAACLLSLMFLGEASLLVAAIPGFSIQTWQTGNGLIDSAVSSVLQTRDGYIWVGTYNGLARFDGVQFKNYDDNNTPELHDDGISCLFEEGNGTLWIGHSSGELTCYQNGGFTSVEIRAHWNAGPIRNMGTDEAGDLWLLNEEGLLVRLRDGLVLDPQPGLGGRFVDMARSPSGTIWVLRNGRVSQLVRGQLEALVPGQESRTSFVQGIGVSRDGALWMVADGQLSKWNEKRQVQDFGPVPWSSNTLSNPLLETKDGWLAAAVSDGGFCLYQPGKGGKTIQFSRNTGFLSDWVTALSEDREGNLWVGTGGAGLNMVREVNIQTIAPPDDWLGRKVLAVSSGRDGALWIGTEGAGIYELERGVWKKFDKQAGLEDLYVWSITVDSLNDPWAGTWNGRLYHLHNNRFEEAPGLGKVASPIPAIWYADQNRLWLGTGDGLVRYEAGKPVWFGQEVKVLDRFVRTVLEDPDGAVWIGMYGGGLGCLKNGEFKQFRKKDGLGGNMVACLHLDHDILWIGTSGGGLTRMKQGRFAVINQTCGLPDNFICDIEEDDQGFIWMSSHGGLIRASKEDLNRCADGFTNEVHCLTYGLSDGMPTLNCSGGFQPAGCQSADGHLWFPTDKGLITVDPKKVRINSVPPLVVIESVTVDERTFLLQQTRPSHLHISPGRHQIEFHYTGLSFAAPEKVRFKYKLEGLEPDWVKAGTRRSVNYGYIPPGHYTFSVNACNNDDIWNETGASIAFEVLPYFWQTTWFKILVASMTILGSGGVAWLVGRQRMHRKLEQLQRQRAVQHERARIAHNIHDDLGANLTRITMLSDPERSQPDPDRANGNLKKIHKTALELTLAIDETVWALDPKHDTFDSLVNYLQIFAQDFLESAGMQFRLEMPLEIPGWPLSPEVRHNLFLAFKEALNNTVKHSSASEVCITLKLGSEGFMLTIGDNGRGFEINPAPTGSGLSLTSSPKGNGLGNMRLRLAEIGGGCEVRSVQGQGTKVIFSLLLSKPDR